MNKLAAVELLVLSAVVNGGVRAAAAQDERAGERERSAEASLLVEQLGAEEFSLREQATTRLIELGVAAKSAVETGKTHPDREIRYRCERILQIVDEVDFQRRLTAFTAGRSEGLDLPAWRRFRILYGDDGETRRLFAQMQQAEAELMHAVENGPQGVARAAEARTNQLQLSQRRAGEATPLGSIAALLFAAVSDDVNLGLQTSYMLVNFCNQASFVEGMNEPGKSKVLRKMLSEWITRSEGVVAQQCMALAIRYDLKEGLIPATRILRNRGEQPLVRQTAMMTVARLGDATHVYLLETALDDASRISAHRIDNVQYETQLRDVALAAVLILQKQDPKQFGFERIRMNESTVFNFGTIGFENEDKRNQAFAKYQEFKTGADQPR